MTVIIWSNQFLVGFETAAQMFLNKLSHWHSNGLWLEKVWKLSISRRHSPQWFKSTLFSACRLHSSRIKRCSSVSEILKQFLPLKRATIVAFPQLTYKIHQTWQENWNLIKISRKSVVLVDFSSIGGKFCLRFTGKNEQKRHRMFHVKCGRGKVNKPKKYFIIETELRCYHMLSC